MTSKKFGTTFQNTILHQTVVIFAKKKTPKNQPPEYYLLLCQIPINSCLLRILWSKLVLLLSPLPSFENWCYMPVTSWKNIYLFSFHISSCPSFLDSVGILEPLTMINEICQIYVIATYLNSTAENYNYYLTLIFDIIFF